MLGDSQIPWFRLQDAMVTWLCILSRPLYTLLCPLISVVASPAARSSQWWRHQLSGLLTSVVASPALVLCARELRFILPGILYVSHPHSLPANSFLYHQPSAVFLHLLLSLPQNCSSQTSFGLCLYPHLVFKTLKLSLKLYPRTTVTYVSCCQPKVARKVSLPSLSFPMPSFLF